MATSYATPQEAVDAVRPGYTIVGVAPNIEDVPNPQFDKNKPIDSNLNPQFVKKQNGTVLSVQDANGKPDRVIISDAKVVEPGTAGGGKGGVGYEILTGPTQTPAATASPVSGWTRLDANMQPITDPTKPAAYVIDPKAPPGSQPIKIEPGNELGDPSTWTKIQHPDDPNRTIGLYDPKTQKVAASVPAPTGSKDSDPSTWSPVYRIPGHVDSGVVGQWDAKNNELHAVSAAPDGQQIVTTANAIYVVDKDTHKSTLVQTIDPNTPAQVFTMGNTAYVFDPKTKTITKGPTGDVPVTVGVSTNNEFYVFFDKDGKEVSRSKNPSFRAPAPTIPSPNTVAPNIQIEDPEHPGQLKWVPNQGQLTIGEATQNLIKSLTGTTADPNHPMTLEEAKTVIDASIAKMTADTAKVNAETAQETNARGAAGDILTAQSAGATTGASLLNQRAATAQNLVQQGLGIATSTGGRYGNYSGGMLSPVPGLGQALASGAQAYATDLGGGQAVYDTAARMVQAADPNNQNPDRTQAMAVLTQMMDKYRQQTGQDFPTVAATKAATQSNQTGTFVPPATISPLGTTPPGAPIPQGMPQYGPIVGTPGVGGPNAYPTVSPTVTQPRSIAQLGFTAPGAIMGIVGPMAAAANR